MLVFTEFPDDQTESFPERLSSSIFSPMFQSLVFIPPEEAFNGAMQMALDEALLLSVETPTMRFYRWNSPCVTFGYFQKRSEVELTHPRLPSFRRWTGGGMVLHGVDLTFSLMIPRPDNVASMQSALFYKSLHSRLAFWLASLLPTEVRLVSKVEVCEGASCFSAPACDDLMMDGGKILGGALRRSHGRLLYQGSLQFPHALSLDPRSMAGALSGSLTLKSLEGKVLTDAERIAESRYLNPEWVERR